MRNNMGYRAHVCTTYQVRYGSGCFSADACDAVNSLLEQFVYRDEAGRGKHVTEYFDSEESVMELDRRGLELLASELENGRVDSPETETLSGCGYPKESLAGIFRGWLESADKSNNFIRIEWF